MTTLVFFGADGLLGQAFATIALPPEWRRVLIGRAQADITVAAQVDAALAAVDAGVVVNAAAYTAVDRAEAEADIAFAVNRDGAATVAAAAAARGLALIHLSTDYVFDGACRAAYREGDPPSPLSVYGATKLAGEEAVRQTLPRHVILRTSWLFGAHGRTFPRTILALARRQAEVRVIDDQVGCPTPAADLAGAVARMAMRLHGAGEGDPAFGLFHYCGDAPVSWHGLAAAVLAEAAALGIPVGRAVPIATADFPQAALRPAWSVMDCSRLGEIHGIPQPSWRRSLANCLPQLLETP